MALVASLFLNSSIKLAICFPGASPWSDKRQQRSLSSYSFSSALWVWHEETVFFYMYCCSTHSHAHYQVLFPTPAHEVSTVQEISLSLSLPACLPPSLPPSLFPSLPHSLPPSPSLSLHQWLNCLYLENKVCIAYRVDEWPFPTCTVTVRPRTSISNPYCLHIKGTPPFSN